MSRLLPALGLLLALPAAAQAGESAQETAARFEGSSLLYENSFSVAHGVNFDPASTRSWTVMLAGTLAMDATEHLGFSLGSAVQGFVFEEETTYANELWLADTTFGATLAVPTPELGGDEDFPLSASLGLDLTLPTSKASQAETLTLSLGPSVSGTVTAPLLDGWSWTYTLGVTPRFHRYTTMDLAVPRFCSAAMGCALGATTNTGWLNTRLQLTHGLSTSVAALSDLLTLSAGIDVTYGWVYAKSPSDRYAEATLSDPANNGGTPVTLSSSFTLDLTIAPHEAIAFGIGLWTPGGMRPNGGWYHPLANRWSQVYVDLTFYPAVIGGAVAKARAKG